MRTCRSKAARYILRWDGDAATDKSESLRTATPNKKITVTTGWNGKQYVATADKNGAWKLSVSTPEAGGPYSITFNDGSKNIK